MCMTEEEFEKLYNSQKEYLNAWGNIINQRIKRKLERKGKELDVFLKIPITVRIKDNKSIIHKAFYRNKNYKDPLNEITDKVGIRVVVLLLEDIRLVETLIENCNLWYYSKDRDFENERLNNPNTFEYQSVHYILKNKKTLTVKNITIPSNTPCEIQIRTLLQHAYSELTHDTVYKPQKKAEPQVHRLIARSMAMIETTDIIFGEVIEMVNNENDIISTILPILQDEYQKMFKPDFQKNINIMILDAYRDEIQEINIDELMEFIKLNKCLLENQIKRRYKRNLLFRQPVVILLYYLVSQKRDIVKQKWPMIKDILKPIYIGLAIKFDDYD